jgi:hypothetical protein
VLPADAVKGVSSGDLRFDALGAAELKGLPGSAALFRARTP